MKTRCVLITVCLITILCSPLAFSGKLPSVVAYYFHTSFRCASCHKIQQFTEEALQEGFSDEIASGELAYKVVNVEETGNEHYVEDYSLYTKSVVLSLQKDGKEVEFKNLDKVWQLLNDKERFIEYIENEVKGSLQ